MDSVERKVFQMLTKSARFTPACRHTGKRARGHKKACSKILQAIDMSLGVED